MGEPENNMSDLLVLLVYLSDIGSEFVRDGVREEVGYRDAGAYKHSTQR